MPEKFITPWGKEFEERFTWGRLWLFATYRAGGITTDVRMYLYEKIGQEYVCRLNPACDREPDCYYDPYDGVVHEGKWQSTEDWEADFDARQ